MKKGYRTNVRFSLAVSGLALANAFTGTAIAQDAAAKARDDSLSEIIVTATRTERRGYDAPTPTTVVGEALLVQAAPSTVADVFKKLPAFKKTESAQTSGTSPGQAGGQSFINLRGLGANRSLILLDGRRVAPSTATGVVDVALLPEGLLQRVDVVTGGASSGYGSDAVAGVINFILDKRFVGSKGQVQLGTSSREDFDSGKISVTEGVALANDRVHLLISGDYYRNDGVDPLSRPWNHEIAVIANPAFAPGNGQPARLTVPNAYFSTSTGGGLIIAGPLRGTAFGPGGAPFQFTYGDNVGGLFQSYPTKQKLPNAAKVTVLAAEQRRKSLFGRISADVTDDIGIYAEGNYGRSTTIGETGGVLTSFRGPVTIFQDNAYLDPTIAAQMQQLGLTSFLFGRGTTREKSDAIDRRIGSLDRSNETLRGVIGADVKLGGTWKLASYYEHGATTARLDIGNNYIVPRLQEASDAVRNANGEIVCRSTLTNPSNGCVPANLFGTGSPSEAAADYIYGDSFARLRLHQEVAAATLTGEPFSTWAGSVSLAAGVEYRKEKGTQTTDPRTATTSDFFVTAGKPFSGSFDVKEGFVELVFPLVKDSLIDQLDLNVAGRLMDYSTSGSENSYKVGLTAQLNPEIRLRGTYSRDVRAPNILELFSGESISVLPVTDPFRGNQQAPVRNIVAGNRDLDPEVGTTIAGGVVVQPSWLPRFSASLDYYHIKVKDAIQTLQIQDIVNRCFAGTTMFCDALTRNPDGTLFSVRNEFINVAQWKTDGLDFVADYNFPLGQGKFSINLLANYTFHFTVDDGNISIDRVGDILNNAQPKFNAALNLDYQINRLNFNLNGQYVGKGEYDVTFGEFDIDNNKVASRFYVNGSIEFDLFGPDNVLFANVDNIFDRRPPYAFSDDATAGGLYDRIGRTFKAGVRWKF